MNIDFDKLSSLDQNANHNGFKLSPLVRHTELVNIAMFTYKKYINTLRVSYLHVFLKVFFFNHIHTSYYELKKLRKKNKDKRLHEWMKILIM